MRRTPDVLVIGGGVIGCAIARAVAMRGRSVLVAERGRIGGEASSAAAGVLSVASGTEQEGGYLAERRASLARFPALAAALLEETEIDVEFSAAGVLELALGERDEHVQAARLEERRAQGFRVDCMDAAAVRAEAPGVADEVRGGLLFPDDGLVSSERLVAALAEAARRRGVEIVEGAAVCAVEQERRGGVRARVGEDWVTPGLAVLAAGAWAADVPGLVHPPRIEPVRGQMLALRPSGRVSSRVLFHGEGCLAPLSDGTLLVGSTVEHVGFEKAVTPAGLRTLLAHIERMAPAALAAPVIRTWSGLRPYAPEGGPVVGRVADTPNLILACGHFRNGILLAPETAERVCALAEEGG